MVKSGGYELPQKQFGKYLSLWKSSRAIEALILIQVEIKRIYFDPTEGGQKFLPVLMHFSYLYRSL